MDILTIERFLKDYLRGADKRHLKEKYGFQNIPSVIAAKRRQIDRSLDLSYQIKEDEILLASSKLLFYVSNYGNVFNALKQRIVLSCMPNGYTVLKLQQKIYSVHRLVCSAFLGDSNLQVNHIDGNKANNHISNLEYCTAKENTQHSINILGNSVKGEASSKAKLTNEQAKEIYDSYQPRSKENGMKALAKRYGVDLTTIHLIVNGKTYVNVTNGIKKAALNPLKLSLEAIEDIKQNYSSRKTTLAYFAEKYGVCIPVIRDALNS